MKQTFTQVIAKVLSVPQSGHLNSTSGSVPGENRFYAAENPGASNRAGVVTESPKFPLGAFIILMSAYIKIVLDRLFDGSAVYHHCRALRFRSISICVSC